MKLLTKYNRINIITTVLILLLSSVVYYFFIRATLVHQLDKDLKIEENEIINSVTESKALPEPTDYKDEQEFFVPVQKSIPKQFSSVDIYSESHHENIYYRQLEFSIPVANQIYKVTIRKSQEETDDLIRFILIITLAIVVILLLALFLVNRILLRSLWKPFSRTLSKLNEFDISSSQPLILNGGGIEEFETLNQSVEKMTNKAIQDYNEIRNFTENASHEIQTPLAIIQSRLELLSQLDNLKEDQMGNIQSISEATNRLSRLNQSLLLLTKIDNKQFHGNTLVDVELITKKIINNYEEMLTGQFISMQFHSNGKAFIKMNETLAEIMISNLFTNAIRHNHENGFIKINMDENKFNITNSGKNLDIRPESLFERFRKDKTDSDSLGLGLSIVKKIAETHDFTIDYTCVQAVHSITINFNSRTGLQQI